MRPNIAALCPRFPTFSRYPPESDRLPDCIAHQRGDDRVERMIHRGFSDTTEYALYFRLQKIPPGFKEQVQAGRELRQGRATVLTGRPYAL